MATTITPTLTASVGKAGRNQPADVTLVQQLLVSRGFHTGGIDGQCGRRTENAIAAFQSGFLARPDARVDPGGTTWRRLSDGGTATANQTLIRTVAVPTGINIGLQSPNNAAMSELLGEPRADYGADCQPVTDALLKRNITTAQAGPLRVTGLTPAIASLREVMAAISLEHPTVYAALGTAGMLCCRLQRGSSSKISNHSWGTAIDLKLNGVLDARGDGKVQYGLTLVAPIFNRFGWYWGASFPTEDGMHFEGSRTLVERWSQQLV